MSAASTCKTALDLAASTPIFQALDLGNESRDLVPPAMVFPGSPLNGNSLIALGTTWQDCSYLIQKVAERKTEISSQLMSKRQNYPSPVSAQ